MKSLIIAEKPSVAATIANVFEITDRQDGYFEGEKYIVTFVFGHLLTLFDAKDYDEKYTNWNMDNLPIIPEKMQYKIKNDSGAEKQFNIIKQLLERADVEEIINACDSDREGSLIFNSLIDSFKINKPIKRLWVSSHEKQDLIDGFNHLKTANEDSGLGSAGYCRQWADWLFGINFTVATTKTFSVPGKVLNVGRVILPVVYLIYCREKAIKEFKSKKYTELWATFVTENGNYRGIFTDFSKEGENRTRFSEDPEYLNKYIKSTIAGKKGIVEKCTVEKINRNPKKLFSQTDLQGHITSKFKGWTAAKVLKICQELYEKQYTTYPRTASQFLDDSQIEKAEVALRNLQEFFPNIELKFEKKPTVFNSAKVDSHPAIIPTTKPVKLEDLTEDEQIIYLEIAKRFAAHFAPKAEIEKTEIITAVDGFKFVTTGTRVISPGWLALGSDEEEEKDEEKLAVAVEQGNTVGVGDSTVNVKTTPPPSRYTVKTILNDMKTCGKGNDEEERFENVLKGYSIGTDATRAEALAKIERIGYVVLKGKSYQITQMGESLCELFPVKEMLEPDFTGKIEKSLKDVENRELKMSDFMEKIKNEVENGVEVFRFCEGKIEQKAEVVGKCPECGKDVVENPKGWGCSGYNKNEVDCCKFALWKEDKWFASMGKKLTTSQVKSFLAGKTVGVKGLKSKAGKTFDAAIKLVKNDRGYWSFEFDGFLDKKPAKSK